MYLAGIYYIHNSLSIIYYYDYSMVDVDVVDRYVQSIGMYNVRDAWHRNVWISIILKLILC